MHRYFPLGRTGQTRAKVGTALLASALTAAFLSAAPSSADHGHAQLHHHKQKVEHHIAAQKKDLDEVSTQLIHAQARLDQGVSDLRHARAVLARLRVQVHEATVRDRRMQKRLDAAVVRLRNARADLRHGQADVDLTRGELASFAINSYQTGGLNAISLGLGLDSATIQSTVDGMQGLEAVGNKQTVALQQLQAAQVLLLLTADRVEATKADVHAKRVEAAENLRTTQSLELRAQTAKQDVATRVADLRSQRQKLAAAKQHEKRRLHKMQTTRNKIEKHLERIAERRARRHGGTMHIPNGGQNYLSVPVNNTYITSPYGMRLHPILHIWELHDGTDFHAPCGTPVHAAAPGRVTSEYYNAGYGNRLQIDHGYVHGASLWTSYNHLTSYVAHVGQWVHRGQLIAFSGTTGYSTACHLHFMVYINGQTVDPMTWLRYP